MEGKEMIRKKTAIIIIHIFILLFARTVCAIEWTTETIDSYGDVGLYTSLALDKDGWPHISYYDDTNDDLKYVFKDNIGWHKTTVDATGNVGKWTSIILDDLGNPHISYWGNDRLKYAYKDDSGWNIKVIDNNVEYGSKTQILIGKNGYPHVIYHDDKNNNLKYAYKDNSGWKISTIFYNVAVHEWRSIGISFDLDIYNNPHVTYYQDGNFKYSYKVGDDWITKDIETAPNNYPGSCSIKLDNSGYPHIIYVTYYGSELKHCYKDIIGWHYETLDDIGGGGKYHSIVIDNYNYPHISYYDNTNGNLKYIYKDEIGWHIQTVQSVDDVGHWPSLSLNYSNEPHISYWDGTSNNLKFARSKSYGPRPFTLLKPQNGNWDNNSPLFIWQSCSYQGDSLSYYELYVDGVLNKTIPKTQPYSNPDIPLSLGWHTWKVKAIKLDGNSIWSNETWSVRIDGTSPGNFNLISPVDGSWTNSRTPILTWQSSVDVESGLKEYRVYIDGTLAKAGISIDSTSTKPLWNLSGGDHTWYIVAVDDAGNIIRSNQIWTIKVDYTGPDYFSLLSPSNSSYTGVDTPTFKWKSTTDAGIGMSQYQLWIDYSIIDSISADIGVDTITFTIDRCMALNHGSHYWYIKALDKLGNYRNSTTWYLNMDLNPPNPFSLQTPEDSAIVTLPTPNFNWYSTSDYTPVTSGLAKYQLWINDSLNVDNITGNSTAPGAPLAEGHYRWFIKAIDKVGNFRNSNEIRTVILDWNPPISFNLAFPEDGDTVLLSSPVLSWYPSYDAGVGVQKYQLFINNNLNRDNISPVDTFATSKEPLENGQYNWYMKAIDHAGNVTSSNSVWSFVVNADYIPPISQITYPADGDTIIGIKIEIQGTSTDLDGIGVDSVFVSTNGGQIWNLVQKVNENYNNWTYLWNNLNYGNYTIISKARDFNGNFETPEDSIRIHVKNSPPFIINPLSDLTLYEDEQDTFILSLDSVFSDLNISDSLSYTYEIIPPTAGINITISKDTHIPSINLKENWNGDAQVIFSAFDNQLDVVKDTIRISVIAVNDPPYFTELMPDSIIFNSNVCDTLKLFGLASDIDNPDSLLSWSYIHSSFVSCQINDTLNCAMFWVEENVSGRDTVVLSVCDGELSVNDSIIIIVNSVSGIDYLMSQIPKDYSLKQNYPNPFNPITNILYGIPKQSHVIIKMYDLLGREIVTLINQDQEPKYYNIQWDAKDKSGNNVSSGLYLYRIVASSGDKVFVKTKKLLLLR